MKTPNFDEYNWNDFENKTYYMISDGRKWKISYRRKKRLERSSARFHQQKGLFLFELTRKDFFYFTKTKQR